MKRSTRSAASSYSEFYVDLDYDKDGKAHHHRETRRLGSEAGGQADAARDHREEGDDDRRYDIRWSADCICVHSDTPGAVAVAKAVKERSNRT